MHISIHVRAGDPKTQRLDLTTHCLFVFVALDDSGRPTPTPHWQPRTEEDRALDRHAEHLIQLQASVGVHI